jgi:sodium transport system ATP-binding protein
VCSSDLDGYERVKQVLMDFDTVGIKVPDALTITFELNYRTPFFVELLEIGDFADRRTKGFSQGQRIKVSLARALVHNPQNVILDEPSNGLDVMATRSLRKLILKLKDDGRCVLFSSHVMQEVAALCDDVVIIANGKVAIDDSTDGIRERTGCDDLEDAFVRAIEMVEPD